MNARKPVCLRVVRVVVSLALAAQAGLAWAQWPQWGGPNRDFTVQTSGLADAWPEDGPSRFWERELGDGYSAIVFDDGVLYTMYRRTPTDAEERTVALDAASGATVWEHRNPAPILDPPDQRWGGHGPNSTPLVAAERLFTVGSRSVMHCFDKQTGEVLWKHDLVEEFGAPLSRTVGYCCSPIAYRNLVIVAAGRELLNENVPAPETNRVPKIETLGPMEGQTLVAFDQATGDLVWQGLDFKVGFSSPILIQFDGEDQLVFATAGGLIGVNPENGDLLWHHPVIGSPVTPVWNGSDLLFYSSGGHEIVGVAVKLTRQNGRTVPEQLWESRKLRFLQPSPVRVGDFLYGSTQQIMLGVDLRTGKRVWAKRGFPTSACVYADGKLISLDENGTLSLATATPEGLTVHSQHKVTERFSYTVPTLVGTTLYVRDRQKIMALDLR